MSGHSKWHKLKHRKAITDSKKSKLFNQLARDIKSAARAGTDPAKNASLRDAIARAKKANVPQANLDRLLQDRPDTQQTVTYEGYGPYGVAILVTATTDNPNRTVAQLRTLFKDHGGRLGEPGSVRWKFHEQVAIVATVPPTINKDDLTLALIDAGASDVTHTDTTMSLVGPVDKGASLEQTAQAAGATDISSTVTMSVSDDQRTPLQATAHAELKKFLEELHQHEDVSTIYTDAAENN